MTESLLACGLLALIAWYWLDSARAREIGVAAAHAACQQEGLQFLDDTVAQNGLRLMRNEAGRLCLQRSFAFEYSISGDERLPGSITLLGQQVTMLYIGPRPELPEISDR